MEVTSLSQFTDLSTKFFDIYPKISEPKAPLSITGISPRIYSHWRKEALLNTDNEDHKWIKLNLFDFIWVSVIKSLRGFGFPLKEIKKIKECLFADIYDSLEGTDEEIIAFIKSAPNIKIDDKKADRWLKLFLKNRHLIPIEDRVTHSFFGSFIMRVLLLNDDVSIMIQKTDKGFETNIYSSLSMKDYGEQISEWLNQPHIHIPLKPLVYDFLDKPQNETNLFYWGFINDDEKKVLDAIRSKEFKELTIRLNGPKKEEMILEAMIDGDILEQKAKEIKRILGLNQYSELTLKYRNDKHIYFKNKTRL